MELDAERYFQGLSYQDLAEQIGSEKMTVHRYLRGRGGKPQDIPYTKLLALCDALGITLSDLLGRAEDRARKL